MKEDIKTNNMVCFLWTWDVWFVSEACAKCAIFHAMKIMEKFHRI